MNYTVTGKHNRYFELFDAGNAVLARMDYPKWYVMRKATIESGGRKYEITPTGFFRTGSLIMCGDTQIGVMKFNGLGRMEIKIDGAGTYLLKRVGLFNGYMALLNEQGHEIVRIRQTNVWALLTRNFAVETDDNYKEASQPFLLLLLIFSVSYMRSMAAAG
jgi:hypothetical protein